MGNVHAIKFQELEAHEAKAGLRFETKWVGVKDRFHLKYLRHHGNRYQSDTPAEYFVVSDSYIGDIPFSDSETIEISFDKIVNVVGYSTDVPLILKINGKDSAVLMPNYNGKIEILPMISPKMPEHGYWSSIYGIEAGSKINVKAGS
jgi:hypothetical protein